MRGTRMEKEKMLVKSISEKYIITSSSSSSSYDMSAPHFLYFCLSAVSQLIQSSDEGGGAVPCSAINDFYIQGEYGIRILKTEGRKKGYSRFQHSEFPHFVRCKYLALRNPWKEVKSIWGR